MEDSVLSDILRYVRKDNRLRLTLAKYIFISFGKYVFQDT